MNFYKNKYLFFKKKKFKQNKYLFFKKKKFKQNKYLFFSYSYLLQIRYYLVGTFIQNYYWNSFFLKKNHNFSKLIIDTKKKYIKRTQNLNFQLIKINLFMKFFFFNYFLKKNDDLKMYDWWSTNLYYFLNEKNQLKKNFLWKIFSFYFINIFTKNKFLKNLFFMKKLKFNICFFFFNKLNFFFFLFFDEKHQSTKRLFFSKHQSNKRLFFSKILNNRKLFVIKNLNNNKKIKYATRHKLLFKLNLIGYFLLLKYFKNYLFKYFLFKFKKLNSVFANKNEFVKFFLKKILRQKIFFKKSKLFWQPLFLLKFSKKWKIYNFKKFNKNIFIKRIKFKPGYISQWINARKNFKEKFFLTFAYQYKLTKYMLQFKKFLNIKFLFFYQFKLLNILIKSKLLPNKYIIENFIYFKLIYLNGKIIYKPNLFLFKNDFIQIFLSYKYYIIFKWFLNWNFKKRLKLKKDLFNKIKKNNKNLNFFQLFFDYFFFVNDVHKYLEVDYFSLSAIILYNPFNFSDFDDFYLTQYKINILNIYNWKYIN